MLRDAWEYVKEDESRGGTPREREQIERERAQPHQGWQAPPSNTGVNTLAWVVIVSSRRSLTKHPIPSGPTRIPERFRMLPRLPRKRFPTSLSTNPTRSRRSCTEGLDGAIVLAVDEYGEEVLARTQGRWALRRLASHPSRRA